MSAARTKCQLLVTGDMTPATGIRPGLQVWCLQLERVGGLSASHSSRWGRASATKVGPACIPESSYWEGPVLSKASDGLIASSWSKTVGHKPVLLVPAARVGTCKRLHPLQTCCARIQFNSRMKTQPVIKEQASDAGLGMRQAEDTCWCPGGPTNVECP